MNSSCSPFLCTEAEAREQRHANLWHHGSSTPTPRRTTERGESQGRRQQLRAYACFGTMREILALRCVKVLSNVDEVKEWAVATGEEEEGNKVSTKHEPLPYIYT